jgi:hypothetical protein
MLDFEDFKPYIALSFLCFFVVLENVNILSVLACRLLRMTQAVEVLPSLAISPTITMCPDSLHRDLLHVALTHSQVHTIMSHIQLQDKGLTVSQVNNLNRTA